MSAWTELERQIAEMFQAAVDDILNCKREGCGCQMIEAPQHTGETPIRLWCPICGWSPGESTAPKAFAKPTGIRGDTKGTNP